MRTMLSLITRLYLVLAVLAGSTAGATRTVLCVESNGRLVIETGQGRCADFAPSVNGDLAGSGIATLPDGCGECVDLPLGSHVLSAARQGVPRIDVEAAPWTPMCLSAAEAGRTGLASAPSVAVPAPLARAVFPPSRTTVLRN